MQGQRIPRDTLSPRDRCLHQLLRRQGHSGTTRSLRPFDHRGLYRLQPRRCRSGSGVAQDL